IYTLSHYGQMLNYNGERVEQSSSLFQVVLLAALHAVTGLNLLTLAKVASIGAGIASLVALSTLVARVATRAAPERPAPGQGAVVGGGDREPRGAVDTRVASDDARRGCVGRIDGRRLH